MHEVLGNMLLMCVAYLRMDERQALPVGPEESSESVHGPGPEQAQSQPQAPPAAYPFMQQFMQMMRNARIIKSSRNRVGLSYLTVFRLH